MLKSKKRPVSQLTRTFAENAAPEEHSGPLDELMQRHKDRRRENAGFMPFGHLTGTEQIVDARIREWMRRMQEEEKSLKEMEDISKKRNIIPKK